MQAQFSLDTSSCKWSIPEVRCSATASSFTARHDICVQHGECSVEREVKRGKSRPENN